MELGGKTLAMREYFSLSNNLNPRAKIPVGKGPIGVTAQTRKSQLIENFDQNSRFLGFYKKNEERKHLLEHKPLNINGASMEGQTQWGLSVYPRDGRELFNLINQSRIRLTQKTKVMA